MELVRVFLDYMTLLCLFVVWSMCEHVDGLTTADIGSPLRVAQCRVECISKFSRSAVHHKTCLHGSDCKMYPGCETACRFAMASDTSSSHQRSPVLVRRAQEVLTTNGQDVRWPPPPPTDQGGPWVYLVMRKSSSSPNSSWKQLTQTVDLSTRVPQDAGMLRVLVVGKDGLKTVYSPLRRTALPSARETAQEVIRSLGRDQRLLNDVLDKSTTSLGKRINTARPVLAPKNGKWNLRLISKIHQQVLVIAEVAWEVQKTISQHKPLYLVTWEVDGGGIQGNLFTDTNCVTLSLWPNTVFHIQVELVNQQDSMTLSKSETLSVDTRPSVVGVASAEQHQPQVVLTAVQSDQRPQLFSGAAAALVSFIILLLVLACTRHCLLDRVIAHSKLVEDLPYGPNMHRVFPPVVTIVQDMRRPSTSKLVTLREDDIDDWDCS
ncbi:uncharacterized protein LOC111049824 isoform X2 [Nilaparvata lugens]|uniref:uncharacterized protein LOC111049824 isoform X2 n=1 Tax=Nilaparvata lugens TaxID=108931 RepID=UPI00193EB225|nr:uncharacterized protein LOC111049824 isoform X2 [Nilaparvata lugens]